MSSAGDVRYQLVETVEDRELVFRLRYRVYVQEMQRRVRYVDHHHCRIEEPYDKFGLLYGLFTQDQCVATVRANLTSDPTVDEYLKLYRMDEVSVPMDRCVISTKIMVDREYRGLKSVREFLKFFYLDLVNRNLRYIFADCNDGVLRFFLHLGFVHRDPPVVAHPEFGEVNLLWGDMYNLEHFKKCNSPFTEACAEWLAKPGLNGNPVATD